MAELCQLLGLPVISSCNLADLKARENKKPPRPRQLYLKLGNGSAYRKSRCRLSESVNLVAYKQDCGTVTLKIHLLFFLTSDNSDDHSVRNCSISRTGRVTWNLAHWWVGFCVRDTHLTLTQILSSLTNLWKPKLIAELAKMPRCLTLAREAPSFSSWELSTLQLDCFCITCPAGLSLLQQKVRSINHVHPFELEQQRTVWRRSLNLSFLHHHLEEEAAELKKKKTKTHFTLNYKLFGSHNTNYLCYNNLSEFLRSSECFT